MPLPHVKQVVELYSEPTWGFEDKTPRFSISHDGYWCTTVTVDPFPCYWHNVDLVWTWLQVCANVAPLPIPLKIAILAYECESRTNAWYHDEPRWHTDEDTKQSVADPLALIVMSGKRIVIHPAMTRYLVAHEYGHAVVYHLARLRGFKDADSLERDYLRRFRPTALESYGARKWHSNIGEMMANDFRILLAKSEVDFWPHDGYERPDQCDGIATFWSEAQRELKA